MGEGDATTTTTATATTGIYGKVRDRVRVMEGRKERERESM